jgi:hypothetical protein
MNQRQETLKPKLPEKLQETGPDISQDKIEILNLRNRKKLEKPSVAR